MRDIDNAEQLATTILDLIGFERPPLNPRVLLHWMETQLGDQIDISPSLTLESEGCSGKVSWNGKGYDVLYNPFETEARQRFTLVHEAAHILQGVEYGLMAEMTAEFKPDRHANAFAAAMLMPGNILREHWLRSIEKNEIFKRWKLAEIFGVSPSALRYRLINLKLDSNVNGLNGLPYA